MSAGGVTEQVREAADSINQQVTTAMMGCYHEGYYTALTDIADMLRAEGHDDLAEAVERTGEA